MKDITITELDGLYREALAQGDHSAADHYDRCIEKKINEMYANGELDSDDTSFPWESNG